MPKKHLLYISVIFSTISTLLSIGCVLTIDRLQEEIRDKKLYQELNIKENCIDIIRKSPRNYDLDLLDDVDNNCGSFGIGCINLLYKFYNQKEKTDDHDPNNFCQGLEDTYIFLKNVR